MHYENDYDPQAASRLLLDVLSHNLNRLSYYLPKDDENKRFEILSQLFKAVRIFPHVSIAAELIPPSNKRGGLIEKNKHPREIERELLTHKQQLAVLVTFAEYLESLQESPFVLEYLKMARQLYANCLGNSSADLQTQLNSLTTILTTDIKMDVSSLLMPSKNTYSANTCDEQDYPYNLQPILQKKLLRIDKLISDPVLAPSSLDPKSNDAALINSSSVEDHSAKASLSGLMRSEVSLPTAAKYVSATIAAVTAVAVFFFYGSVEQTLRYFSFDGNFSKAMIDHSDDLLIGAIVAAAALQYSMKHRKKMKELYSSTIQFQNTKIEYTELSNNYNKISKAAMFAIMSICFLVANFFVNDILTGLIAYSVVAILAVCFYWYNSL